MRGLRWLVSLALLTGCVVEEDPSSPVPASATPPAPTEEPAPTPQVEAPPDPAPAAPPAPRVEPVAYEGRTGRWACLPDGPSSCRGADLGVAGENAMFVVPLAGVTRLEGALAWDAATPATERLTLSLVVLTPCGEGCNAWETLTTAAGPSPLALETDVPPLPPGGALGLRVEHALVEDPPVLVRVSLDQAFAFAGEATVLS